MSEDRLTARQVRSIEKAFAEKDRRQETKELQRQRQARSAAKKQAQPRRRDWDESDEDGSEGQRLSLTRKSPASGPMAVPANEEAGAIVLEMRGQDFLIAVGGKTIAARLPPRLVMDDAVRPVAGDMVKFLRLSADVARVVSVEPRRSALRRRVGLNDFGSVGAERIIAANVDQVVLVCSPSSPPFRAGLIDRYLVAAGRDRLHLLLCLNKVDLGVSATVAAFLEGYQELGVDVVRTSTVTGDGLDSLRQTLQGHTSVFTGHSGVGKSSLLNALEPGLALRTGAVTAAGAGQGKGRHTTSSARLLPLSLPDTYVVDAPGIRAFGIGRMTSAELAACFPELAHRQDACALRGCRHSGEAGCAVKADLETSEFGRHRLESYRRLLREVEG